MTTESDRLRAKGNRNHQFRTSLICLAGNFQNNDELTLKYFEGYKKQSLSKILFDHCSFSWVIYARNSLKEKTST